MTENKILESMIRQPISPELQAAYDAAHKYLSDNDVTHNETVAEMAVNEAFHAFVDAVREQSKGSDRCPVSCRAKSWLSISPSTKALIFSSSFAQVQCDRKSDV